MQEEGGGAKEERLLLQQPIGSGVRNKNVTGEGQWGWHWERLMGIVLGK